ncbi:response regulator transcription factor [Poseidonibacter lekithochrous]|uniref:response regulator transcription factor n=1 Tax=Poseidonibacter TaxID=2321187 RepID=UPI001C0877B6|nr:MULTISPECIES: response regulator transcription factor [Poseidonibacter]MBU3014327.1 response regulator transcription factor [Poseidonibacter lekithochrous]MDO6827625.1 response regulator transcription factor [Poseidonibacter sp. 1_MG-2023]
MKILLLEDDFSLNEAIKETLENYNYKVDSFYDGMEAYMNISNTYDLYILDINTPSLEGIDLLAYIKKSKSNSRVLMISAIIDIEKIREAYSLGCDDYIKKPFEIEELLFKIERINKKDTNLIEINSFTKYYFRKKELYIEDELCPLTKNEKNFLHLLIENHNQIIDHSKIEDFVYEGESKTSDAIRSMVKRLRKKMNSELIENVLDEGYRINTN